MTKYYVPVQRVKWGYAIVDVGDGDKEEALELASEGLYDEVVPTLDFMINEWEVADLEDIEENVDRYVLSEEEFMDM